MSSHLIANDTVYQLDTGTSIPVCVCVDCGQIADNFGTVCCSPTAENKEPALSLTVHRYISLGVLATCSLCFRSFFFLFFFFLHCCMFPVCANTWPLFFCHGAKRTWRWPNSRKRPAHPVGCTHYTTTITTTATIRPRKTKEGGGLARLYCLLNGQIDHCHLDGRRALCLK